MRRILEIALLSSALAMSGLQPATAGGLNIGGSNGVSIDVDTSDGVGVGASVGGKNGVNAGASVGGSRGVADVDASVGGSRGVNASANVGARDGLSADADVSVGGSRGLKGSADAKVGSGVGLGLGLSLGGVPSAGSKPGKSDPGGLTAPQRQALRDMSASERQRLLKRCGSINASSYDPALVELCRLLQLSASR